MIGRLLIRKACVKKFLLILVLAGISIFIGRMIAAPSYISGDCMEPAVKDGSYVFLNRITPYVRDCRINEIITFEYEGKMWISRVVGLEGDTIEINDNGISLDGVICQEKEFKRDWDSWKYGTYAVAKSLKIPLGHVYVLSDKLSAHHDDSCVFGPISKASIVGVVW